MNDIKILWTNLCTMIKVILVNNANIDVDDYSESDFSEILLLCASTQMKKLLNYSKA